MKTNTIRRKLVSIILILSMTLTMCFAMSEAVFAGDQMNRVNFSVSIDGKDPVTVKAYNASYTYHTYISLRDLSNALSGTEKNMNFEYDAENGAYRITTNTDYIPVGEENQPFDSEYKGDLDSDNISLQTPPLTIDGKKAEYRLYPAEGNSDAYMKLVDLGLVFGISVDYTSYNELKINTGKEFVINMDTLEDDEYFHDLDGVYLGNVDSGKTLYTYDSKHPTEVASTSKMMTFLLVQEAIDAGKIKLTDTYKISEAVMEEANSEDSTSICRNNFELGKEVTIKDLIAGMMLPSANECATALAEVVSGSEAAFVKKMNSRAKSLGLSTAKFVNPHGLPNYVQSQTTGKRQNKMSAEDMFKLTSYLMKHHKKALTEFTSQTSIEVPSFGEGVTANSTYSTLIYNLGVIGLKTGTTNRSGACIVTAIDVEVNGKTETIVSVVLGAEDNRQRYEASNMLLKYAQQYYAAKTETKNMKLSPSVSAKKGSVTVKWKASANADGYQVYRSVKKTSGFVKKADTKKTSYTNTKLKKGSKYYYKVRGYQTVGSDKFYSDWSKTLSITAK